MDLNAALLGKSTQLPFDLQTQQVDNLRRRKLLEALQAQAFSPKKGYVEAGGHITPDYGALIGTLAQAYFSKKGLDELKADEDKTTQEYNKRLSEGAGSFLETLQGKPGSPGNVTGELTEPMENVQAPVAPNPRKAIVDALATGLAPMQQAAMGLMGEVKKGGITALDYLKELKGVVPNSLLTKLAQAFASGEDPATALRGMTGKKDVKVEGGVAYGMDKAAETGNPADVQTFPLESYNTVTTGPNGEPRVQVSSLTNKAHGVTSGDVTPKQPPGFNEFEKVFGEGQAKQILTTTENLKKAQTSLPSIMQLPEMVKDMYSGAGADFKLGFAKWAKTFGLNPDDPKIQNSETVFSIVGERLLTQTRALGSGSGFSEKDLEFLQRVTAADLARDPETMLKVAGLYVAGALNINMQLQQFKTQIDSSAMPDSTKALVSMSIPPFKLDNVPPEFGVRQDPHTGFFTVDLPGGRPAPRDPTQGITIPPAADGVEWTHRGRPIDSRSIEAMKRLGIDPRGLR